MTVAENQDRCLLLFSGGSDSCLAALQLARQYRQVVLLTLTRKGFSRLRNVELQVARLERFFGGQNRFELVTVPHDRMFKHMLYERYLYHLRRYGSMMLSHCGLCKVAMHWRGMIYALENGFEHVADGAVRSSEEYPAQNERIMLSRLREIYQGFGLRYENPVYEEASTEQALYELRFHSSVNFKGTEHDLQIMCDQQVLYAMFMRHFRSRLTQAEFESQMAKLYAEKLSLVESMTKEYLESKTASKLHGLIEYGGQS